ncbi:MAG: FeoB small GTPase domain-containing protein [Methanotrichaceae archaeon]
MKILLMGHPNVGKSVVFNRLTGVDVITSNYPGTTVEYSEGSMQLEGEDVTVIDVPGTFSLDPKDLAEKVAVDMLEKEKDAIVVSVVDSSKIERGLYLTLEIIERGYSVVLALNMWDMAKHKGIKIDVDRLSEILGVPVVPMTAISGEGVSKLVSSLKKAKSIEVEKISERAVAQG